MSKRSLFVLAFVFGIAAIALGQTDTGRVIGTISDASGAVIDHATVNVTNTGTARNVTAETNDSGQYVLNALPAGKYHVEIRKDGFKTATVDFTLEVSQVQEISLKLETGEVTTTVDVTSGVPLVDTATSSMGEVIQGRQVTELPLNGRNFTQLALLTPGVTRGAYGDIASGGGSGTNAETFRNSETGGAALSANGLRPQADNFILDGVDNNDAFVNGIIFFPPAESIQEFKVNTSVAPAEFGKGGGAIVQTSIKSGTNDLHGSAFLFRRSGFGAAEPYGQTTPVIFRQAQFGGTVGGAIWKNKLFGFGDYQGRRQINPNGVEHDTVPTDRMRGTFAGEAGVSDFSELLGTTVTSVPSCAGGGTSVGAIYNPITCTPFPGNMITNPNPIGLKYFQTFPEPNTAPTPGTLINNYVTDRQQIRNFDDFDFRIDFNASQKDQVFFRYSYAQDNFTVTNSLGPLDPSGFGSGDNVNHPRGLAVGYTRTISPTIVNEFRFGYISSVYGYNPPDQNLTLGQSVGIPGANPTALLGGQVLIGGNGSQITYQGDGGPYNVDQKLFQFTDSLSYVHGRHVFKFGTSIGQRRLDYVQGNDAKGYFILGGDKFPGTGRFTGYEASEIVAGFPDYDVGQFQGLYQTRSWETGYFAQDDWHVNNRLTLNLGLRYDYYTWPYEVNNRMSNWLPDNPSFPGTGLLISPGSTGAAGLPRSLINNDKRNWAPRIGFAYDLRGDGKTVLRGGYGIFYYLDRGGVGEQLSNNPDFNGVSSFEACPGANSNCSTESAAGFRTTLSGMGPTTGTNPIVPAGCPAAPCNDWTQATNPLPAPTPANEADPKNVSVIYWPGNSRNSNVQQWNLQLERQVGGSMALDIAYVGTKMTHLATAFNANNPIINGDGSGFWSNLGGAVNEFAFIGDGTYNGLQVGFTRRLTQGLQFTSAYTWSHTIDDSDSAFSPISSFAPIFLDTNGNPLLKFNKGNSPTDIRNNFVFASLYELPFGKGKQFGSGLPTVVDYVIGGWQWNNIITLQSGTPYDLNVNGSPENRPDITGPITVKLDHATALATISGNFSAPPLNGSGVYTRPGTLGRDALYGPGFHDWDSGMMKDFPIKERVKVEFRADVFNMFNHPQFQNGSFQQNLNQGTVTNGITATTNPMVVRLQSNREMQFALRITF
jgi:Carboxypeptidase regulatory-like domain